MPCHVMEERFYKRSVLACSSHFYRGDEHIELVVAR
jgi:hypothetical protein